MILHLSDLHLSPLEKDAVYGDFKHEIVPKAQRENKIDVLKLTLQRFGESLSNDGRDLEAVVITGDITIAGDEAGYQRAEEVLDALGAKRPAADRICVVPGNHDVVWGVTDSTDRYRHFITYVRKKGYITPLLEGIDLLEGRPVPSVDGHILFANDLRWALLPINSSHYCGVNEPITPIGEAAWQKLADTVGTAKKSDAERTLRKLRMRDVARISPLQLEAVRAMAKSAKARIGLTPTTVIAALHHQILPVSTAEELKAFESISNLGLLRIVLRENGINVVLHGHKHSEHIYCDYVHRFTGATEDRPVRICVISAPAVEIASGRPVFNILDVPKTALPTICVKGALPCQSGTPPAFTDERKLEVWPPTESSGFAISPLHVVEGESIDEVYERVNALFGSGTITLPHVICRLASPPHFPTVPRTYPPVTGEPDLRGWMRRTVDWWQKGEFRRLPKHGYFNHGNRIFLDRGDQLQKVAEVLGTKLHTSRGFVSLINPEHDFVDDDALQFPSLCSVQFIIRDGGEKSFLEVVAFFRKQEMKHWWPVNINELVKLQLDMLERLRSSGKLPKELAAGPITTIATTAHVKKSPPVILVPAIDFDLEESPEKLWTMTYALCFGGIGNREKQLDVWDQVLNKLNPPEQHDKRLLIPAPGVQYLREISDQFAKHHGGPVADVAKKWADLDRTNGSYLKDLKQEREKTEKGEATDPSKRYKEWRDEVRGHLQEIRKIIGPALKK